MERARGEEAAGMPGGGVTVADEEPMAGEKPPSEQAVV
jgi:hypothetical protein